MPKRPWIKLKRRIEKKDSGRILEFLRSIPPSERARAVSHLNDASIKELLKIIPANDAADLLADLPDEQAADLIELLSTKDATNIVHKLPFCNQADILAEVQKEKTEAILDELSNEEAQKTREILQYPEDSAGGIMQTEFLTFPDTASVGDVLDELQNNSEKYSDYETQYIYLTSETHQLRGVLRLRDLIFSSREKNINKLTVIDPVYVHTDMPLEKLIEIFEENKYIGLPVTDKDSRIVGVVRKKDVLEAAGDRNRDTYLKFSGIVGGEELRSMPLLQRSRRRLSWLSANILLNIVAASVIALFQDTLSSVIALAVFLPIISDMSGCSGNQAVAVSIRELTLGLVKPHELLRVLFKEMGVGVLNGLVLGVLLGVVAILWKGNPYFGLVVGGALAINTVVAVCLGGLIPLYLKKLGKDPALASGPILTTITDLCGFLFALGFATLMLPYLS